MYRPSATDYRPKWGSYRGVNSSSPYGDDQGETETISTWPAGEALLVVHLQRLHEGVAEEEHRRVCSGDALDFGGGRSLTTTVYRHDLEHLRSTADRDKIDLR